MYRVRNGLAWKTTYIHKMWLSVFVMRLYSVIPHCLYVHVWYLLLSCFLQTYHSLVQRNSYPPQHSVLVKPSLQVCVMYPCLWCSVVCTCNFNCELLCCISVCIGHYILLLSLLFRWCSKTAIFYETQDMYSCWRHYTRYVTWYNYPTPVECVRTCDLLWLLSVFVL